ncbi:hypothetical protein GIB67_003316 [Kingdonia uniflora]|uniref:Peroxidase n=1 Tax=Kingdonia uniflora TaxID=39325 RepID=A0A7J7P9G4_9MAGN|nr:hypothetical protein GIB67_003316 [Kingdonia uniflora]
MAQYFSTLVFITVLIITITASQTSAQLSESFYAYTCPFVNHMIQYGTRAAIYREPRMGASLLRLFFHDCFVNGCDGGILLDDGGEKTAAPNINSIRGYEVIDNIKAYVDRVCGRQVVSCTDILAVVARDSVVALGGPWWPVLLGRRDSRTGNPGAANTDLPRPTDPLNVIINKFSKKGFNTKEMVALSGGHTIGFSRCTNFKDRIYSRTNIDPAFATSRQSTCPHEKEMGDDNLAPLEEQSPFLFGNNYYQNLVKQRCDDLPNAGQIYPSVLSSVRMYLFSIS